MAANLVPCPKGCGWYELNPALDEEGRPYSCFLCCNEGVVSVEAAAEYAADLAAAELALEEAAAAARPPAPWEPSPWVDEDIPY